jgi:hypothetical protein
MADYYPPWGFYFKVEFDISKNKNDVRFQAVSGLSVEYDYESFKEGGENRFEHKLPVRTKYADLVLKRGMLTESSVDRMVSRCLSRSQVCSLEHQHHSDERNGWAFAHLESVERHPEKMVGQRSECQ